MQPAPIILFVYNRPEHTLQTLNALSENILASESILYIYADGFKANDTEEQKAKIIKTRSVIRSKKWCKEVHVFEKDENLGLAKSIIHGVSEIIEQYGKVIVLEDDLISSHYFLQYMNDALTVYENEHSVACISGYVYPIINLPSQFMIKGIDCWGWATWKRAWDLFEEDGQKLLDELESKNLTNEFDFDSNYPYTEMLKGCIAGQNNSWAVRWHAATFLRNKYCLYPGKSLIKNIGTDGTGTHPGLTNYFDTELNLSKPLVKMIEVKQSEIALNLFKDYFKRLAKMNVSKSENKVKKLVKSLLPEFVLRRYRSIKQS